MNKKGFTPFESPKRCKKTGLNINEDQNQDFQRGDFVLAKRKMSLTGFTLIELMIVIAIIAIIASLAIPSLIKTKLAANETAAASTLKLFNGMMATYRHKRYGGWGFRFPWSVGPQTNTGKYCGLYYEVNNAGEYITLIGAADAAADAGCNRTNPMEGDVVTFTPVVMSGAVRMYQPQITFRLYPKQGYWFGMCLTNLAGYSYNIQEARHHYAVMAGPVEYGQSGESTYIMNEDGTVYSKDWGESGWRQYPGPDPGVHGWEINN